mmetsp:Transcript_33881/g.34518  ORF Transcript_33881/g.34518 Transcript_33881/m.34518 type:complete len:226 (+) Transcript_33881:124-801(+)|eukprot:CAMPEP_0182421218 /NCGR_PEP_ID=MMETSP1167-20130531/6510_1 /TAXON_ID=2988 /ORGANISM="Mallomonas Sp, Strain CCMP3275" /LENGTH=225 /DNA_ID=CAMNT_0024598125 /DNA_START=69 /DNA_END=746 /DNA_ORIENTATION=+
MIEVPESNTVANKTTTIHFKIQVNEGIDPCNIDNITIIEIKAYESTKLSDVHNEIVNRLEIDEPSLYYALEDGQVLHDVESNNNDEDFYQLKEKDLIILNKKKFRKRSRSMESILQSVTTDASQKSSNDENNSKKYDEVNSENIESISVICTTRIIGSNGEILPKLRIIVHSKQECKEMMEAVSNHWNKVNLKFKLGRIVIREDRTFQEQGIEEGSEIVVTGGRG